MKQHTRILIVNWSDVDSIASLCWWCSLSWQRSDFVNPHARMTAVSTVSVIQMPMNLLTQKASPRLKIVR